MGTSKRLAEHYDLRAAARAILKAASAGPLQSLSKVELELDCQPVTIYPRPQGVRAWVRFGPEPIRVDAALMRTTPHAAGIQFSAEDQTFRCWVWGNAVTAWEPPE